MKCHEFQSVVVDFAREQLMGAAMRDAALAHAGSCERCAAAIANERSMTVALNALAESHSRYEAPAGVEVRLLAVFREKQRSAAPVFSAHPALWRPLTWAAAAAAVVIIAIGATAWLQKPPSTPGPPVSETVGVQPSTPSLGDNPAATPPPFVSAGQPVRMVRANTGARCRSQIDPARNAPPTETETAQEITTEFMPLSYVQGPASDGLQLVRVELPRSALVSFGLPVNTARGGQPIKADVVLGHDGVAHAIRFVH